MCVCVFVRSSLATTKSVHFGVPLSVSRYHYVLGWRSETLALEKDPGSTSWVPFSGLRVVALVFGIPVSAPCSRTPHISINNP